MPPLRAGPHAVEVVVAGPNELVVTVDGVRVLDAAVAVPAKAFVGFTDATGGLTDIHAVSDVRALYGASTVNVSRDPRARRHTSG